MAISYTYHGQKRAEQASGQAADTLGKAEGTRTDVADGAASSALTKDGWYQIVASTTSYVLIDASAANGTGGEHFPAGVTRVRWIEAGNKIGCSAGV